MYPTCYSFTVVLTQTLAHKKQYYFAKCQLNYLNVLCLEKISYKIIEQVMKYPYMLNYVKNILIVK